MAGSVIRRRSAARPSGESARRVCATSADACGSALGRAILRSTASTGDLGKWRAQAGGKWPRSLRSSTQILLNRERKSPLHPTWEEGGFWIGTDQLSAYFAAAFLVAARFVVFFATEPVAAATFAAPLAITFMTADWRAARRAAMFLPIFLAVLASLPKTVLAGVFFAALLVAEGFLAVFFLATFDPSMRPGCETGLKLVHLRICGYALCASDKQDTCLSPMKEGLQLNLWAKQGPEEASVHF